MTNVAHNHPASEISRGYADPPAKSIPFEQIPLVDFKNFRNGSPVDRAHVAQEIGHALGHVGFFYLINHGIPEQVTENVFRVSRAFFAQPLDLKLAVSSEKTDNHRGYFPLGGENVDPLHTRDLKEGFDIGFEGPSVQEKIPEKGLRGSNQWPKQPPEFREVLEPYYEEAVSLGREICRAFALALSVEESTFDREIEHSESRMRLLSYPPQPGGARDQLEFGAGAHTDCGCLTILAQDDSGGLAVRNAEGDWISVEPIEGALVCNVGDMMEQWSGGQFSSTVHRVINSSNQIRYSVALFFNPSFDVMVDEFKSLLHENGTDRGTSSAGEYLRCCYDEIRSACQLP